ncbi:DUF2721 domain-containing protein [Candidatus Pseudothioglobus sp. Uisw_041]|jgi:hypothetical protein|uniref:DUF2721 domain-containing protein n=2 Tax=Candidatus Pseudothioglobus TaxID=2841677 RepID=UPI0019C4D6E5|nr:DUF2721 domain-containing protein [Candidatus Pseudothioglobus aerophilus]MBT3440041.1 DUF2721 domain-containing protein [Gammaproteobacteria bacterium]MDB4038429.1 DUF2721 domain-containing protein [Candidatus Thioglobus sp.]MDO7701416.1 DUF2721 domain-containing protein [SAR86 cluster bacterium]MBT4244582.1 DUF2721 domain-containing protein [Gammaproteobacteria bacterium]
MDMTTPALLFPAISLLFVAYTNRLHSLSVLIRAMTTEGSDESKTKHTEEQLDILKKRVTYIKRMQVFGIVSFIFNLMTIICFYIEQISLAYYIFGFGLLMLSASLIFALLETLISTKALDIHLENYKG